VLAGDLEQPRLGLSEDRYRQLSDDADTVVHAAALVNHALPYAQLFEANVLGTVEVMRLALAGRPKRFNYTSTNSVSLALLGDRELALESDDTRKLGDGWPAGAARHANGYQLSKWAGEVLAQDLCETFGIPVNVFRCNLILPPARARAQINPDDFLTRLICSVVDTGIYPRSFYDSRGAAAPPHLDGFPVDFTAAAIAAITAGPSRGHAIYHVNNVHWSDGVSLDSVMSRLLAAGYPLARVDDHAAWFQRFERALRELPAARRASSSLPIIDQWRTPLAMEKRRRIDASRFRAQVQALRPQGLEDIPHLDDAYFDRCIEDLRGLGLIGAPRRHQF
jgi:fatty acid CoA ligase FadD9